MSLFNFSTFFIYLAIFFVFIFLSGVSVYLYVYSRQQFEQQNHKINSMVSLINMFTQQQQQQQDESPQNINTFGQLYNNIVFKGGDLITVSDDDNIEELEEEDEEEEEEGDDEEEEEEEEEEDEDEEGDDDEGRELEELEELEGEGEGEELKKEEEEEKINLEKDENNLEKNIKSVSLVEIEDEIPQRNTNKVENENGSSYTLNLIDMEDPNSEIKTNLEEEIKPKKSVNIFDYKKLSLIELKKIIVEKGVVSDASKMKKLDILKLLGEETTE